MWYTAFGALSTMIVAALATFVTGASDASLVSPKLLAPCIRKYLKSNDSLKKAPKKPNVKNDAIPEVDEDSAENEKESVL